MVVAGEVLFLIGVDNSIMTMGNAVGAAIPKFKKIWLVLAFGFLFGFLCTMAEPDLMVLGKQVNDIAGIKSIVIIAVISLGVGIYVALSLIKTFTGIKLKYMLIVSYIVVFALAIAVSFINPRFLAVSFDSGGVTTGPITVPFILAMGIGVASSKSGAKSDDSFGVIALASIGPIVAMLIFGLFSTVSPEPLETDAAAGFTDVLLRTLQNVAIGLGPITVIFLVFQFIAIKLPARKLSKILAAVVIDVLGLVLFVGGVASGPMTATFSLPLLMGMCAATGADPLTYAFGVVAIVAMMPLIAIQALGIIYKYKSIAHEKRMSAAEAAAVARERELVTKHMVTNDSDFSGL
jgi:hypothetical protein